MILSKPIIFFDLETTGVNVVKDKIVQIAILKIFPDGEVYWSFGKHKDCLVKDERQYADWVLRSDFPTDTKNRIKKILSNEQE